MSSETETVVPAPDAEISERIAPGVMLRRLARGDLGSIRVLLGIAVIWTIFQIANDRFLSVGNLTNLSLQIAAVATISIGVVLVLLLGEIDLSVGAVSGLAAAVMAVLSVKEGLDPTLAIFAGLLVGTAIGFFNGFMVTIFGLPSFVVTLAGLLAWQGAQLAVLGDTGSVNLPDSIITDLTSTFFDPAVGWALGAAAIAAYAVSLFMRRNKRVSAGLEAEPAAVIVARVVLVAVAILATVYVLNEDRGVPLRGSHRRDAHRRLHLSHRAHALGSPRLRCRRQRRGRAARGHPRRTGSSCPSSPLPRPWRQQAAILAASRLLSVNQQSGSGDVLLLAIAGPVIAGHLALRRPRLHLVGAPGSGRHRLDLERDGPARARLRHQVHDHGSGVCSWP